MLYHMDDISNDFLFFFLPDSPDLPDPHSTHFLFIHHPSSQVYLPFPIQAWLSIQTLEKHRSID